MLQRTLPAGFIAPCLPTKTTTLPSGSQWLHEIKHDGFRIIARKSNGRVRLYESIVEHVAGVEDYQVALATYRAACERWPGAPITLRQGSRVIEDSRRLRVV